MIKKRLHPGKLQPSILFTCGYVKHVVVKAKIEKEQTIFKPIESDSVGFSYSPYLTANFYDIQLNIYKWGESDVRIKSAYQVNTFETRSKPPVNNGERFQKTLSRRGKSRIKKAARFYQYQAEGKNKHKGHATMITISYGKHYPDDRTSKRDLDAFLKRLRRKVGSADFHYCWIAERQKRGAIHYHILTPHFVPKEWINENWNEVVNNRYARNDEHEKVQILYPNVIAVYNAGAYLVKYLQKEGENIAGNGYNMSQATSKAIKPETITARKVSQQEAERIFYDIEQQSSYSYQNEYITIQWLKPQQKHWIHTKFKKLQDDS